MWLRCRRSVGGTRRGLACDCRIYRCPHHAETRKPRADQDLGAKPQPRKPYHLGHGRSPQTLSAPIMTDGGIYNVLFLCTGNSARSILAEALIDHWGKGRFKGYSAGSFPKSGVQSLALEQLETLHRPTRGLHSKSWNEFARPGAPVMDFVFTVCDEAAGEACPVWPGNPVTAHWGVPDPAAVQGTEAEQRRAFREAYVVLENRIKLFIALPIEKLDRMAVKRNVDDIGRRGAAPRPE